MSKAKLRRDWVFLDANGCAIAVADASFYKTEDKIWREKYPTRAEERAAAAAGVTCIQVDHQDYVERHMPCLLGRCDHVAVGDV